MELYEVQVTMVALICLDLMASMAQLLPFIQQQQHLASEGGSESAGLSGDGRESADVGGGAWARLLLRILQVLNTQKEMGNNSCSIRLGLSTSTVIHPMKANI